MKKALIITFAALFAVTAAFAQKQREQKMQAAIDALMTTQFVQKYKEYKDIVEVTAGDFKAVANNYDPAEVNRIKLTANQPAWTTLTRPTFVQDDFRLIDKIGSGVILDNTQHPNFSQSGSPFSITSEAPGWSLPVCAR